MRKLILATLAATAIGTTVQAGTLDEVVKHGIVLILPGIEIEVDYTPDGKFTAAEGQVTGGWRIDGDKFCTTSNMEPVEQCVAYPLDKKSGDSFDVTGPAGTATIKIR
jgi:hypothetical protein